MRPRKTQKRKRKQRKTRQRGGAHFSKARYETVRKWHDLHALHTSGNAVVIPISAHGGIPPTSPGIPTEFSVSDPRVSVSFYVPAGGVLYCTRISPTKVCTSGYATDPQGTAIIPHDIYQGEPGQMCPNYILTHDTTGAALAAAGVASSGFEAAGAIEAFRSGVALCQPNGRTDPVINFEEYYRTPGAPLITLQKVISEMIAYIDGPYRLTRGDTSRLSIQFHCLFCRS